jgi:hypothetical protein
MQLALQRQRVVDLYHTVEQYILQDLLDYFFCYNFKLTRFWIINSEVC